jgi:pimeloyl-ACP methyl ester carboxylesterase
MPSKVLVLWGRNDQILEPKYAQQFVDTLPDARLTWLEDCGHCGHLERPRDTADAILGFLLGEEGETRGAAAVSKAAKGASAQ